MPHLRRRRTEPGATPEDTLRPLYAARRRRVDTAQARMIELSSRCHRPAEARAAAADLQAALDDASAVVRRALAALAPGSVAERPWAAELVRLGELAVRLRRTTVDDLGVRVPATVQVGSRAATGPHVAGLVAEPADLVAATLHQPSIGVALRATIDAAGTGTMRPTGATRRIPGVAA